MKPRSGEGQNGRLRCPMGFLVSNRVNIMLEILNRNKSKLWSNSDILEVSERLKMRWKKKSFEFSCESTRRATGSEHAQTFNC